MKNIFYAPVTAVAYVLLVGFPCAALLYRISPIPYGVQRSTLYDEYYVMVCSMSSFRENRGMKIMNQAINKLLIQLTEILTYCHHCVFD